MCFLLTSLSTVLFRNMIIFSNENIRYKEESYILDNFVTLKKMNNKLLSYYIFLFILFKFFGN